MSSALQRYTVSVWGRMTHIKHVQENWFVHITCIKLMYLNINNFGYVSIVLSLDQCCGHKKKNLSVAKLRHEKIAFVIETTQI